MIWSVSTLLRRSGTPMPVWVVNFSMSVAPVGVSGGLQRRLEVGDGRERAADRRRGRDERRDEVRAATLALATLEVAVRGRGAALARGELVGVHAQAHRAPRVAPL